MLLTIKHRLLLLNILPSNGNYDTLLIIREQQDLLGITGEEHERLGVKRVGDMVVWDESKDVPVEIEITKIAGHIIKRELTRLNDDGRLQMEFLPLYEHFVGGEEWSPAEPSVKPLSLVKDSPQDGERFQTTKETAGAHPLEEGSQD